MLLATFVSSLVLIAIRGKTPLVLLNWLLLVDGIAILFIGTYIWFFTLHERNNYHQVFGMQSNATKIAIQDQVRTFGALRWGHAITAMLHSAQVLRLL